jgi:hypothetical protein
MRWMGRGCRSCRNRIGDLGDVRPAARPHVPRATGRSPSACCGPSGARRTSAARGRAREFAGRELTFEATARPLVEWAASPRRAPDEARRAHDPWGHAEMRQRVAAAVRRVPGLRGSETLVALWRRLFR